MKIVFCMLGRVFRLVSLSASLAGLFALTACMGSGGALRGVGAGSGPQTATAPVQRAVLQTAAREEKLNEGTPLNLTVDAASNSAPLTPAVVPPMPQMANTRPLAVGEIRAKAAATGNIKPDVFDVPKSSPNRMTAAEQSASRAQMQEAAARNAAILSSGEAEAKANSAKKLKQKAQTHYDAALQEIEN